MAQIPQNPRPNSGKNTISNHFSPRFTNEPWADKSGLIIKFSRRADGKILKGRTNPRKWGAEDHLYRQDLEDALERLETRIAPIYRKILNDEILNYEERFLWGHWLLCQYSRTPSFMIEFAKLPEDLLSRHATPDFASLLNAGEQIEGAQSHIADFTSSRKFVHFIVLRDWVTYRAAKGEFFIKSDVPVIIRGPLVEEDTAILYPLSPEKCFSATVTGGIFPPRQLQIEHQLNTNQSRGILKVIASTADREIICHVHHDTPKLKEFLNRYLGISSGHFRLGQFPE